MALNPLGPKPIVKHSFGIHGRSIQGEKRKGAPSSYGNELQDQQKYKHGVVSKDRLLWGPSQACRWLAAAHKEAARLLPTLVQHQ